MSTHSMPSEAPARRADGDQRASWLLSRAFWGAVSIVAMWLAVLFVGIFGSDIDKVDAGGGVSSVPVVVVVAVVALFATMAVAHRALGPHSPDRDLRKAVEDERRDIDRLSAELDAVRRRLPD